LELIKNPFKAAIARGELQIGLWSSLCSPIVADVISDSGYDWIVVDTEHSPNELPSVLAQLQVYRASATTPMVRPAWNDTVLIKRFLDIGAQTLLLPYVQNVAEARAAVAATRYPPAGVRGVTGSGRGARFGRVKDYLQKAAEEICVIVQVETGEALKSLEAIASVEGVDGVFIGPADLAASMGHVGNPQHADVQAAIKRAAETLKRVGKPAGILTPVEDEARRYIDWGYTFVAVGSDMGVLLKNSDELRAKFR
jgi:4-hydroxy-2-oxoheptanedioate aldolase